jgi:hypothetical protein
MSSLGVEDRAQGPTDEVLVVGEHDPDHAGAFNRSVNGKSRCDREAAARLRPMAASVPASVRSLSGPGATWARAWSSVRLSPTAGSGREARRKTCAPCSSTTSSSSAGIAAIVSSKAVLCSPFCSYTGCAMPTRIVFQGGNELLVDKTPAEVAEGFREMFAQRERAQGSAFYELPRIGRPNVLVNPVNIDYIEEVSRSIAEVGFE